MLKETITYTDFNDVSRTEELYFNLTKTEMSGLFDLLPRLQKWAEQTAGDPRNLSTHEIVELLDIIKILIKKSYGVKTEDGRHFRKSPDVWADFEDSAAYDAFVFGLFEDPVKAVGFMTGILPQDLAAQVEARQNGALPDNASVENGLGLLNKQPPMVDTSLPGEPTNEPYTAVEEEIPAWMRENRNPTEAEFRTMTEEQKLAAFRAKSQS